MDEYVKEFEEPKIANYLHSEIFRFLISISNILKYGFDKIIGFVIKYIEWGINSIFILVAISCMAMPILGVYYKIISRKDA